MVKKRRDAEMRNLDAYNMSRESWAVVANTSRCGNVYKSDSGGFPEEAETSSLFMAKLLVMLLSQFIWTLLTCKSPRERC
jgi:hypothetical protein